MRAWYTDRSGLMASLCMFYDRHTTRLIIRDPADSETIFTGTYPSWGDAITALLANGEEWHNDLTGQPL